MNFSNHKKIYPNSRKSDIFLLRSKNKKIQQDHDQYIQSIQKQEKLLERRDLANISKLNRNLKAIEDFKKVQFDTEYELRLEQIRNSDQINSLDSSQYQKLCEDLKFSLGTRFKTKRTKIPLEEKISPVQSQISFGLLESRSATCISSRRSSTSFVNLNFENKNVKLS